MHELVHDIGISVISATALGYTAHRLKQPIILGYLLAGVLIGPHIGLGLVSSVESIEVIAELGLILLLFIIGLEVNLRELLRGGRALITVAGGQFPIGVVLGFAAFTWLPVALCPFVDGVLPALYLAIMCGLSSTAIVVKALYDKGELDTLPGRMTIGTLVVQDLFAILVLALQPNLEQPSLRPIVLSLGASLLLLLLGFGLSSAVLRRLLHSVAKTPEMVVCLSLAWCALLAGIANRLGLSKEMGALVAGLSVSAFPYSLHVTAKALSLRDFFLTLFFVSLGMAIKSPTASALTLAATLFVFVAVSRFLSVYPLAIAAGLGRRVAFVTSVNLLQMSEFSLVVGALGVQFGHITGELVGAAIISMGALAVVSSYAIRFSHELYRLFCWTLARLGVRPETGAASDESDVAPVEIVLLGYHRMGKAFLEELESRRPDLLPQVLVIDFNPVALRDARERGVRTMFGDIGSLDTLRHAGFADARFVLSTVPDMLLKGIDNLHLARLMREVAPGAHVVATGDDVVHEARLLRAGCDLVIRPFDVAGAVLAEQISDRFEVPPAAENDDLTDEGDDEAFLTERKAAAVNE